MTSAPSSCDRYCRNCGDPFSEAEMITRRGATTRDQALERLRQLLPSQGATCTTTK